MEQWLHFYIQKWKSATAGSGYFSENAKETELIRAGPAPNYPEYMKLFSDTCKFRIPVLLLSRYQSYSGFKKGGLTMQKNRNNQNRIKKLTIKGAEVLSFYRS